jgi:hypothetical protein
MVTGLLTHIDEIGPTFREIQLGYESDRLHYLRANGLFIWTGKGDHRRCQLRLEAFLVVERDGGLILKSCEGGILRVEFVRDYIHLLTTQVSLCF